MTRLRSGSASHTGLVRQVNQDASLEAEPVFAVADGMGGHAGGEVASQVAIDALRDSATSTVEGLVEGIRAANRAVLARAGDDPELRGMGTTLCALALVAPGDGEAERVALANVGDSRIYLLSDDELLQLSDDHSLVEELVREGRLDPAEARDHPQKNIVTRVLGSDPDLEVDTWEVVPSRGDRFLLCSDGLSNEVDDDGIAEVLRRVADPGEAADELVRRALEGGGRDNVTVVVVDVTDDGGRARAASASLDATATSVHPVPGTDPDTGTGGAPAPGADGDPPERPPRAEARGAVTTTRPRRLTWRSVLFVAAVMVVVGGAVGSVLWFARSTYYVGTDGDEVAIYQGRPGGVLWIRPTLVERTGLAVDDVPPARREAVAEGKEEPSLAAARRYVANLEDQAAAITTATPDPAATTTTTPPP